MRKVFYSLIFAFVLLLAGAASLTAFDEPSGGGTVPAYQMWLPVVGKEPPCRVSEGMYFVGEDRYPPPGPYYHGVFYTVYGIDRSEFPLVFSGKITITEDALFQNVVASGGHRDDLIQIWHIHLPIDSLIVGQRYYARMSYICYSFIAETPIFSFVAQSAPPEE